MSAVVEFRGVDYSVTRAAILQDLHFTVEDGETLVLLGRSGSGKTTALKMVNRLLLPSAGEVLVEGKPTAAWDPIRLRRRIGYVIQETGLFPHFTVAENIGLVPRLEGWAAERIRARVDELLESVDLPPGEFRERYPRELSGGQRQRVGVARALAADPPVLLFDEPFGALDPVTRFELQRQFLVLRDSLHKTAIFVTHDVREALMLGTRIGLMHAGHIETLATPQEFLRADGQEARAFLASLDWNMESHGSAGLRSEIASLTVEHLELVLVAMLIAAAVSIPAGILLTRRAGLRRWVLGFANVLQTIPSLALFGFPDPGAADRRNRQTDGDRGAGALRAAADPAQHASGNSGRGRGGTRIGGGDGDDGPAGSVGGRAAPGHAHHSRGSARGDGDHDRHGHDCGGHRRRRARGFHFSRNFDGGYGADPGGRDSRGGDRSGRG